MCPAVDDSLGHAIFSLTTAGPAPINVTGVCETSYSGVPWRLCYPNGTWSSTQSACEGAARAPRRNHSANVKADGRTHVAMPT